MSKEDLKQNSMMAHLLESLEGGKDIGNQGRLVFTMVARHFMEEKELLNLLQKDKGMDEEQAMALIEQVKGADYNPPRREKILQFMQQQDFPICPDKNDPDACNVYKDLQFPDEVYQSIQEYRRQKASA